MAYTTINKSSDYFNTKLYTGNFTDNTDITGVGFQPDLVWLKERSSGSSHLLQDAVRGANKDLFSDLNSTEESNTNRMKAFISDGFTLGAHNLSNQNGETYASWNWKANGTGSANTDGSISSTVSANTTSGFSIVSYTGNGTGNSTIGHGLGTTPKFIIVKNLTTAQAWGTKSDSFVSASDPNVLYLNVTSAQADDTNVWGTSAVFNNNTFTVGDWNGSNQSSSNFIAYCWSEVQGYSKFGSYVGNGSTNGTFVYTGFKPAFVMVKKYAGTGSWFMKDAKRNTYNPAEETLAADSASSAAGWGTGDDIDLLSNGFKMRDDTANINTSGDGYIYMAFAEAPLVGTNGVTAKAR